MIQRSLNTEIHHAACKAEWTLCTRPFEDDLHLDKNRRTLYQFCQVQEHMIVVWSATAVKCISEQEGVRWVKHRYLSSSREYLKLIETQQDSSNSSSPPFLQCMAYPGGASIKGMWMHPAALHTLQSSVPPLLWK